MLEILPRKSYFAEAELAQHNRQSLSIFRAATNPDIEIARTWHGLPGSAMA